MATKFRSINHESIVCPKPRPLHHKEVSSNMMFRPCMKHSLDPRDGWAMDESRTLTKKWYSRRFKNGCCIFLLSCSLFKMSVTMISHHFCSLQRIRRHVEKCRVYVLLDFLHIVFCEWTEHLFFQTFSVGLRGNLAKNPASHDEKKHLGNWIYDARNLKKIEKENHLCTWFCL